MSQQQPSVVSVDARSQEYQSSSDSSGDNLIAVLLIVAGALLRIVSYLYSDNSGGDAWARVALAARWLQHPTAKFVFDTYPPGHFWLIGLMSLAVHDVAAAGRLLSLLLGIGSLFAVWKLARLLYGNSAALFSLGAFCFYSLHIGYSTTSSAEVSYLFFLLAGLLFFFAYAQPPSPGPWCLAVSGVLFSISESIRYEAWVVFGASFILLPLVDRRLLGVKQWGQHLRSLSTFGLTGGAWPAFMMAYSWRAFGDPMYLVHWNRLRVLESLKAIPLSRQLTVMPLALFISVSPIAIAAAIYGLAKSLSWGLKGGFAFLTLFFGAVQAYQILTGGLLATPRYTITLGAMLTIVAGYGFEIICRKLTPERMGLVRGLVIALLCLNSIVILLGSEVPTRYADKFANLSPRLRYHPRIVAVADYLRRHMRPSDAIVIDDYNVESDIIAAAAGLPILAGDRAYLADRKNELTVRQYILAEHPHFLVYADQGTLRSSFALPPGCSGTERIDGVNFRCAFAGQIYRVYELSYP
jgi:Dolichyl-phosphate-mannose-protein mannosyltransferase